MFNHAAIFLRGARQEARHVYECEYRNFKTIAEAHKTRGLAGRITIQTAREDHRLVRDDADRLPFQPYKTTKDIFGEIFLNFKKVAFIGELGYKLFHIIGNIRIFRDERIEALVNPVMGVIKGTARRAAAVI